MSQYKIWCSFEVLHSYYHDGTGRDFDIRPVQTDQAWLQQQGIRWHRSAANTWQLWVPSQLDVASLAADFPSQMLSFEVISNDPYFFQFTESPIDQLGYFRFSNSELQPTETAKIKLSSEFVEDNTASNNIAIIEVDLNALRIESQFQISFEARRTRWQYYIIKQQQQSLQGALVLQGKEAHLFTGPASKKIPNNMEAECFDSTTNLFPVQERSSVELSLSIKNEDGPSPTSSKLIARLPTATPRALQLAQEGEKDLISVMYIYL